MLFVRRELATGSACPECSYLEGYYTPYTTKRNAKAVKYSWNKNVDFFLDPARAGGSVTARADEMREMLTSVVAQKDRRCKGSPSKAAACREAIDNYPIEWPHAPEGHDGEFRQACDKLAGQRRVTLRGGGFAAVADGLAAYVADEDKSMADRKRGFVIECSAEGLAERR